MSDVFEGPGWWLASNGKWYPPEHHPDERYQQRFATPAPARVVEAPPTPATAPIHPESSEHSVPILDVPVFDTPASDNTETTSLAELRHHLPELAPEMSPVETAAVPETAAAPPVETAAVTQAVTEPAEAPASSSAFPSVELRPEPDDLATRTTPLSELARSETETVTESAVAETAELSGSDLQRELERVAAQREADQARAKAAFYEALDAPETPDLDAPASNAAVSFPQAPAQQSEALQAPIGQQDSPAADTRPEFSVASSGLTKEPDQRPIFEHARPPSITEPPQRTSIGFTKVEIDSPSATAPSTTVDDVSGARTAPRSTPSASASASTDLVHVPTATTTLVSTATLRDRFVAIGMFIGGVALIVGSFLDWTGGTLVQTGWERGEGIITVIAGVLGASMAGPIFIGFRHVIPKTITITAGVIAAIALGLVAVNSVLSDPEVTFGLGYPIVGAATGLMLISAVADEGEFLDD